MPLDIRPQVITALDNINKNPELYPPSKSVPPLETRINGLKETNPSKYKEYLSTLASSANNGNEKARELLGKIGEDAARQRRGYEGLNTAMFAIPAITAGIIAAPTISTVAKGTSWLYGQLPQWIRTGTDVVLTADGVRNAFSNNGIQKTIREAKAGNYKNAVLSGIGDVLDLGGGFNLGKKLIPFVKNNIYNTSKLYNKQITPNLVTSRKISSEYNSLEEALTKLSEKDFKNRYGTGKSFYEIMLKRRPDVAKQKFEQLNTVIPIKDDPKIIEIKESIKSYYDSPEYLNKLHKFTNLKDMQKSKNYIDDALVFRTTEDLGEGVLGKTATNIQENSNTVYLKNILDSDTAIHEFNHAASGNGYFLPKEIIEHNAKIKPKMKSFMKEFKDAEYYNQDDEIRARALVGAIFARNNHLTIDQLLRHRNTPEDIQQLKHWFEEKSLSNYLKNFLSVSPITLVDFSTNSNKNNYEQSNNRNSR